MKRSIRTLAVAVLALSLALNAGTALAKRRHNPNKPQNAPAAQTEITGVALSLSDLAGTAVSPDPTSGEYTLVAGLRYKAAAVVAPEGAKASLTWRSSKPRVASVTNKGAIFCNKPGKATIAVMARPGGVKTSIVVNVVANEASFDTTADRTIKKLYLKGNTLYASVVVINSSTESITAAPSLAFFLKLSGESDYTALGTKTGRIRKAIAVGETGTAVYKLCRMNARNTSLVGASAYCQEP